MHFDTAGVVSPSGLDMPEGIDQHQLSDLSDRKFII